MSILTDGQEDEDEPLWEAHAVLGTPRLYTLLAVLEVNKLVTKLAAGVFVGLVRIWEAGALTLTWCFSSAAHW